MEIAKSVKIVIILGKKASHYTGLRIKVNFLFDRANIFSKKPAHKIGSKIKKRPTF